MTDLSTQYNEDSFDNIYESSSDGLFRTCNQFFLMYLSGELYSYSIPKICRNF
jgi:hypothetical protein